MIKEIRVADCLLVMLGLFATSAIGFAGSPETPIKPKPKDQAQSSTESDPVEAVWHPSLSAGTTQARLEGKPIFVIVGAEWCGFCKKLEEEIKGPTEYQIAQSYVLVKIDSEVEVADARRLRASALPALRVLSMDGETIAGREGYLPAARLLSWLGQERAGATPLDPSVLTIPVDQLDPDGLGELVRMLSARDVTTRRLVLKRLGQHPAKSAPLVVESFSSGGLAQRLACLQLLRRWAAPIDGIDPWVPTTVTVERVDQIRQWQQQTYPPELTNGVPTDVPEPSVDAEVLRQQIERMLAAPRELVDSQIASLADHPDTVCRIAEQWLQDFPEAPDDSITRLRRLLYQAGASASLRLSHAGTLRVLAEGDAEDRRKAASRISGIAGKEDVRLISGMLRDGDPLIREMAVQTMVRVVPSSDAQQLTSLLSDPDKNVRAAVLKQLSVQKSDKAVQAVSSYLEQEADDDLKIYAIRYLKVCKSVDAVPALARQAAAESWQVRAAAVEALAHWLEKDRRAPAATRLQVSQTVINALADPDSFVASKAASNLANVVSAMNIADVLNAVENHPELLPSIAQSVAAEKASAMEAALEMRIRFDTGQPEAQRLALRMAVLMGVHGKLDTIPSEILTRDQKIQSIESEDKSLQGWGLRLILLDLQRDLLDQSSRLTAFYKPGEVFETTATEPDALAQPTSRYVDGQPFESETGLVDLFARLNLDEVSIAKISTAGQLDHSALARIDDFLDIEAPEPITAGDRLPRPKTIRELITALWNQTPASIKARRHAEMFTEPVRIIAETSDDAAIGGLAAAIGVFAQTDGQPDAEDIAKSLVRWAETSSSEDETFELDRRLQSGMLPLLRPSGDAPSDSKRDRARLLECLIENTDDFKLAGQMLITAASPAGTDVFDFVWGQYDRMQQKADGALDQKWEQLFLDAIGLSTGDLSDWRHQLFDQYYQAGVDQVTDPPLPQTMRDALVDRCDAKDASSEMSLAVLVNGTGLETAMKVARRWFGDSEDSEAGRNRRFYAASVMVLALAEMGQDERSSILTEMIGDQEEKIALLGLRAACGLTSDVRQMLSKRLRQYPQLTEPYELTVFPDREVLKQVAAKPDAAQSGLATALLILQDPTSSEPIESLFADLERTSDDDMLNLLAAVLVRRDQADDADRLSRLIKRMNEGFSQWQLQQANDSFKKLKSPELRRVKKTLKGKASLDDLFHFSF